MNVLKRGFGVAAAVAFLVLCGPNVIFSDTSTPAVSEADTAWVLVSSALVLIMTPGVAFFYAGDWYARKTSSPLCSKHLRSS